MGTRRAGRFALLLASAAGTAAILLAPAGEPPDGSFPLLVLALVPLVALVVLEHRRPVVGRASMLIVGGGLLVLAVVRPPHESRDVWSYAMYGRMVAHDHVSPYTHVPAQFPSDPILAHVDPGWRHTASVYGPVFTWLSGGIMAVTGTAATGARVGFQLVACAALLGTSLLLARARVPASALAAATLNPLVIVWVGNGAHNDALVGLAVLAAALALARPRLVAAGVLLAGAILVKAVAVLPALAAAGWLWRHHGRRAAATFAAAVSVPVAAGYLAVGGWAAVHPLLRSAANRSRVSLWNVLPDRYGPHAGLIAATAVVVVTAVLVAVRLGDRSALPALIAGLAGYLLVAGYVLPWYFAWVLPIAALDAKAALSRVLAIMTMAVALAYEYQTGRPSDRLDHLLHAGVSGAQLLALAASVTFLLAAVARLLRPAPIEVRP